MDDIKWDICIDLFFIVLVLVCVSHYATETSCGIPVYEWIYTYFMIVAAKTINNVIRIVVTSHFAQCSPWYVVGSFFLVDGAFLGWLIYGNILFYSSKNDCFQVEDTQFLYNFMLILLIVGYF